MSTRTPAMVRPPAAGPPTGRPPAATRLLRIGVPAVVLLVVGLLPLLGAGVFTVVIGTQILAYALLVMSVNLMAGVTGLLTLAHAAYFGVGAYAAVLTARHVSANALTQLGVAVAAGGLVAAATGWIAVRTSGTYFLMLSLAIGELLYTVAQKWDAVTGGSDGLAAGAPLELAPGSPMTLPGLVYWWAFAVFCVFGGLLLLLVRSPFGTALRGIRDNEPRMRAIGYPTPNYKYAAYVLSGVIAGAGGYLLVAQAPRFISPDRLSFHIAGLVLLAAVIGGLGSMWGSCFGAALIVLVGDVLSQDLGGHGPMVLGAVFVLAVYVLPRGVAGLRRRRRPDPREV